jgi:hypothetical protein
MNLINMKKEDKEFKKRCLNLGIYNSKQEIGVMIVMIVIAPFLLLLTFGFHFESLYLILPTTMMILISIIIEFSKIRNYKKEIIKIDFDN